MAAPNDKAGERKRDEARPGKHLSFAGGEWDLSDQLQPQDKEWPVTRFEDETEAETREADGAIESGAQTAGMGRGEAPRKSAQREKSNPKPSTKTKKKASTRPQAKKSRH